MEQGLREGIVFNGRFLTQRMTGVQRYAREVVHALDVELELICPRGAVLASLRKRFPSLAAHHTERTQALRDPLMTGITP
jgi:hypothetical protein